MRQRKPELCTCQQGKKRLTNLFKLFQTMKTTSETVLVTGGSGYLGAQCIARLLQDGYAVRTTLRSLSRVDEVRETVRKAGAPANGELSFVEADLTRDDNWAAAVEGCRYVLHVASPFPAENPADENELIIPAREGALRVLRAARDAGVKRVVLTSSFAAIGYGRDKQNHVFSENDWTNVDAVSHAYVKSKALAERAAWDFIAAEGNGLELTVINPVGIFGPVYSKDLSASVAMVIGSILSGAVTETPDLTFGAVDVRDVADIHVVAMTHEAAAGERFLATADGTVGFYEVAGLIRRERPERAEKVADLSPIAPELYATLTNDKARRVLGWTPRSWEESILATVDTLN